MASGSLLSPSVPVIQTSKWLSPGTVNYSADPNGINTVWTDIYKDTVNLSFPMMTKTNVKRISLHDLAATTIMSDTLIFSNFAIPTVTTLIGLTVHLHVRRLGRVTDYVIQPVISGTYYNNNATGTGGLPDETIYGSSTDNWGISTGFNSSNFQLALQLGPHPQYPGSDEAIIDSLAIQLVYL